MPELQTTLPIGALLRERYVIKGVLGTGVTGTVYLTKDQQAKNIKHQLFALKEISDLDQQARYQFTFSGTALRQLQHPALPHIHHIFNDDKRGCVYLVMDYVEGVSLEALRLQRPAQRLSWSELRPICEPIASALTYLHRQEKPLFHGDLAPTNIIQSITGKIMFLDLGYAQAATATGMKRPSLTSASYRSPEQLTGEIDELSDVYGLGAMLYKLLTGQEPADALTRLEWVNKKRTDPLTLASKIAPEVHRPLAEALQKALALDPAERFGSIKEFREVLSALPLIDKEATPVANRPNAQVAIGANPVLSARTDATRNEKRRVLLPAATVLCALLLLLAGLSTWAWASAHSNSTAHGTPGASQQGRTVPSASTITPDTGKYLYIIGTYRGPFTFLSNGNTLIFTVSITHQNQDQFSGTFTSTLKSGTLYGSIDRAKNPDITITFVDSSHNAFLYLSGGFNGIPQPTDSAGGSFVQCKPSQTPGLNCISATGPNTGGQWGLNYESSIFIAPTPSLAIRSLLVTG